MARRKNRAGSEPPESEETPGGGRYEKPWPRRYRRAVKLASQGRRDEARHLLEAVAASAADARLRALARNDLAALDALDGDREAAMAGLRAALEIDPGCLTARLNLDLLRAEAGEGGVTPAPTTSAPTPTTSDDGRPGSVRVAILSFLFNWPSTGGGIVHTVELARFLGEAGYDVRHVFARYEPWGVGRVEEPLAHPHECLEFDDDSWSLPTILAAYRRAVDAFAPDWVIVTDSWSSKPLLADAVRGHRTILRLQAMDCLCPLNNVRLLPDGEGGLRQCHTHQLADPDACAACLDRHGPGSGSLHRAERELCGVGTAAYREVLMRAFREAEAVLAVNPLAEAMVAPHSRRALTVTAGMDPARFPWPGPDDPAQPAEGRPLRLLFAGLVDEPMKGFPVLHEACELLWERRRDFELWATSDPPGPLDEFTRLVGWKSQAELPRTIRAADVLVVPTVAQEALGRTAVEAMAAGRPVVAARLGGLPFTVAEGSTGLLFEPGDPEDLARTLEELLDDAGLRERMGAAGRRRFERRYAWPVIIERHYKPLLGPPDGPRPEAASAASVPGPPAFVPTFPRRIDHARLVADVARFFGLAPTDAGRMFETYRRFHEAKGYARAFGELKTLCFEEAYVLAVLMSLTRPRSIAEVGTQHGQSTRRILDLAAMLGLEARVTCFDLADIVEHFAPSEARLVVGDVTGRFRAAVLEGVDPDLIFLDVHGHGLLSESIAAATATGSRCVLAIHDCGRGLCNPRMTIARDNPDVGSGTGVWERHVLAEQFGVADPLDPRLDDLESPSHRLRIFDTPHGLALVAPRAVLPPPAAPGPGGPS